MTDAASTQDEPVPEEGDPESLTEAEEGELVQAEPNPAPVVYSGQDFDVEGLVRRLNNEDILVPTFGHADDRISSAGFQRGFVWSRPQMDRFIESLLLGYPIPGIFMVRQADKRYLVLDGQQRLRTLQYFYNGIYAGKEFALQNVGENFKGLRYKTLQGDQRRTLDNAFLQATIVDTDGTDESLEAVYQIFERLNSGGTQLTPHEIRVALSAGPFIDYIESLNQHEAWRQIYGKPSPRIRDQEIILRIIALYVDADSYSRPQKTFLNEFALKHRRLNSLNADEISYLFQRSADLIAGGPGRQAVRPRSSQVNAALTEALFVGLMRRIASSDEPSADAVASATRVLLADKEMDAVTSRATADEESVKARLRIATKAFLEA